MSDFLRVSCVTMVALSLSACVETNTGDAVAFRETPSPDLSAEPTLRSGDRVQVTVFGEDKISGEYEIGAAGSVSIPLTGTVKADGLTPRGLEAAIGLLLKQKYLKNPRVTVSVASLRPFYVLGEVEKPGEYPFKTGLNLWRAIAIAGGQTYRASSSTIFVQHAGEPDMTELDLSRDVTVKPGDLIRVPERWF